jgi:cellobiose-specific phosphotransferase system component IIA
MEAVMGCNCGERRNLTAQALNNLRKGDVNAARQNVQRFAQTVRQDARAAKQAVQSVLTRRPPSR